MSKAKNFDDFLKEELKNENLKKEYDSLEEEFTIAKEIIQLRNMLISPDFILELQEKNPKHLYEHKQPH